MTDVYYHGSRSFFPEDPVKVTLTQFKLAVIATDEFSDPEFIEQLLLDLEVTSADDIREIMGMLSKHRPEILDHLLKKYPHLTAVH